VRGNWTHGQSLTQYSTAAFLGRANSGQHISISLHTVAVFCEHTAEMLEGASDDSELIKRHPDSLIRLRDGLAKLLDGSVST
jgi:hypothetical protein